MAGNGLKQVRRTRAFHAGLALERDVCDPRATDGGNKDGAAHHSEDILALCSSNCQAKQ